MPKLNPSNGTHQHLSKIVALAKAGNNSHIIFFNTLHTVCFMYELSIYEIKKDMTPDSLFHNLT